VVGSSEDQGVRCAGCGTIESTVEPFPLDRQRCGNWGCRRTYRLVDLLLVGGDFWMFDDAAGCNARSYKLDPWDSSTAWAAFCRCGWHGPRRELQAEADEDAGLHREETRLPGPTKAGQ
jgi:hypothetical protein